MAAVGLQMLSAIALGDEVWLDNESSPCREKMK